MTTSFLNSIFYGTNPKEVNKQYVENMKPYMLTKSKKEYAIRQLQKTNIKQETVQVKKQIEPIIQETIIEKEKVVENVVELELELEKEKVVEMHTLTPTPTNVPTISNNAFWLIYISVFGMADYTLLGKANTMKREMEEKQKMLDVFMKTPTVLKQGKLKMTNVAIQEYCSDLLLKKDDARCFCGYSAFYKINILLVFPESNCYLIYKYAENIEGETPTVILNFNSKTRMFELDTKNGDINIMNTNQEWKGYIAFNNIKNNMVELEHYDKPMKSHSAYKVADLESIITKLGGGLSDKTKNMKKQDTYNVIFEHLNVIPQCSF